MSAKAGQSARMRQGLKRELGLLDLTMMGLGAIIGSGWLLGSQKAGNIAGPAAIFSWVIGGVMVLFIALVYAELGSMLPESGGLVRYSQYSHGSFVSYIMAFALILADSMVIAIEAEAAVQYASYYAPWLFNSTTNAMTGIGWIVGALLCVIFFFLNYLSVKAFARSNTLITALKFLTPVLTLIVLFTQFQPGNLSSHGFAPFGLPGVFAAISSGGVVFSYFGFRQAVVMSGEAKNPQRDIPLAIGMAIGIGIVLYILLQTVFIGALPAQIMAKGWGHINFSSPFAEIALLLSFNWLAAIIFADAVISPFGTGNIYMGTTSRLVMAQSENGFWWKVFKKVDPRAGVPRAALWFTLVLAIVWTAPFPSWGKLVGVLSNAVVFTYMIGPVSVMALRRTAPKLHRPFALKALPLVAGIAFVVGTLVIYWSSWSAVSVVMLCNLFGLIIFAGFLIARPELRKGMSKNIKAGVWLIVYMLFILALSRLGSAKFGGTDVIKYPMDQLVCVVGGVIFFLWANASAYSTPEIQEIVAEQGGKQVAR
ncbi:Amino acid/polyamine transporter I [Acididesulfobacillus acetoxydans]|uniref:Amino acid/polyamine transporter I n=1 Tax=Acididesulfobacillus acetoxydans TaxID=1561005 RepID=A0A8S0VXQ0_9FIRM|nr:APC family permease [Acididesulfobacillus acetoxydans]CAA7602143.1 Amino acid/polyamine transporter I [Acididesulfobacillus acetoxydans]CEJ08014.1 Aspartate-proton symporter [Acididesulfobacillus acetoxydans]